MLSFATLYILRFNCYTFSSQTFFATLLNIKTSVCLMELPHPDPPLPGRENMAGTRTCNVTRYVLKVV